MNVQKFDPRKYGEPVAEILADEPLPPLGPGEPNSGKRQALKSLNPEALAPDGALQDREMALCCVSGLWLLFNFLDESHKISQDISSSSGSYWHGIMHRREPDYSNGKYWFRQVGGHPIFDSLCEGAKQMAADQSQDTASQYLSRQDQWDPFRFVDLCQEAASGQSSAESLCRRVAQLEWRLLFDYCYDHAVSG